MLRCALVLILAAVLATTADAQVTHFFEGVDPDSTYTLYEDADSVGVGTAGDAGAPTITESNEGAGAYSLVQSEGTVDEGDPPAPTGVAAEVLSVSSIRWSWNVVTDPEGSNPCRYEWEVLDGPGGTEVQTGDTQNTEVTITGLDPNTQYCLVVNAYDTALNDGPDAAEVCETTDAEAEDTTPPPPPGGLIAEVLSTSSIRWDWSSSTDAEGSNPCTYTITITQGGDLSLRGDPDYDPGSLTADEATWKARLDASIVDSWGTATARADSDDTYELGRYVNNYVGSLLMGLRATGDLAYLDSVAVLTEIARADLADAWDDATTDGYLNWRWRAAAGEYFGNDLHQLDEAMTHGMVGMVAHAFHVNRDLDAGYAEKADFWLDYLENHFLAKWIERAGSVEAAWESDAFGFGRRFTHPRGNQLRLAHYLADITGDADYANRARTIAEQLAAHPEPHPSFPGARRWKHQWSGADAGWAEVNYAQYLMRALMEMRIEGRPEFTDAVMAEYAATFRDVVYNDAPDHDTMAEDVNGDGSEGIAGYGNVGLARWDDEGTTALLAVADSTYSSGSSGVSVSAYALMAVSDREGGDVVATVDTFFSTLYTRTGLSAETEYCATVTATDSSENESDPSSEVCATTTVFSDSEPPPVPTGLVADVIDDDSIRWSWNSVTDGDSNPCTYSIVVYESAGDTVASATSQPGTSYTANGLDPETEYCATVRATDAVGNPSASTAEVCDTTEAAPIAGDGFDTDFDIVFDATIDGTIDSLNIEVFSPANVSMGWVYWDEVEDEGGGYYVGAFDVDHVSAFSGTYRARLTGYRDGETKSIGKSVLVEAGPTYIPWQEGVEDHVAAVTDPQVSALTAEINEVDSETAVLVGAQITAQHAEALAALSGTESRLSTQIDESDTDTAALIQAALDDLASDIAALVPALRAALIDDHGSGSWVAQVTDEDIAAAITDIVAGVWQRNFYEGVTTDGPISYTALLEYFRVSLNAKPTAAEIQAELAPDFAALPTAAENAVAVQAIVVDDFAALPTAVEIAAEMAADFAALAAAVAALPDTATISEGLADEFADLGALVASITAVVDTALIAEAVERRQLDDFDALPTAQEVSDQVKADLAEDFAGVVTGDVDYGALAAAVEDTLADELASLATDIDNVPTFVWDYGGGALYREVTAAIVGSGTHSHHLEFIDAVTDAPIPNASNALWTTPLLLGEPSDDVPANSSGLASIMVYLGQHYYGLAKATGYSTEAYTFRPMTAGGVTVVEMDRVSVTAPTSPNTCTVYVDLVDYGIASVDSMAFTALFDGGLGTTTAGILVQGGYETLSAGGHAELQLPWSSTITSRSRVMTFSFRFQDRSKLRQAEFGGYTVPDITRRWVPDEESANVTELGATE